MSAATDLMVTLAKIQQQPKLKAELAKKWRGYVWESPEMHEWAKFAWKEGLR